MWRIAWTSPSRCASFIRTGPSSLIAASPSPVRHLSSETAIASLSSCAKPSAFVRSIKHRRGSRWEP
jgi:hypothetical protein